MGGICKAFSIISFKRFFGLSNLASQLANKSRQHVGVGLAAVVGRCAGFPFSRTSIRWEAI